MRFYTLRMKGKVKHVFAMLDLLAKTMPEETDINWWGVRLWLRRN